MPPWAALTLLAAGGCTLLNEFESGRLPEPPGPALEESAGACGNGEDDDGDGDVDCHDAGCASLDVCLEESAERCANGVDDDVDGYVDCADDGCAAHDFCIEGPDVASCSDEIDNDADGHADCQDPACFPLMRCIAGAPLSPREDCAPAEPAAWLGEAFEEGAIDLGKWQPFHTDADDRPAVVPLDEAVPEEDRRYGLWVNGEDNWYSAGVASTERFTVGAGRPIDLRLTLQLGQGCQEVGTGGPCGVDVELHTRDEWRDGAAGGRSLLGVVVNMPRDEERVAHVWCTYLGRRLTPERESLRFEWDGDANDIRLKVQTDPLTGEVVWSLLVGGQSLSTGCRAPPLTLPDPVAARLVIHGKGDRVEGRVLVTQVRLRIGRPPPTEPCRGVRRPILADRFCPDPSDPNEWTYLRDVSLKEQGPWRQGGEGAGRATLVDTGGTPVWLLAIAGNHRGFHSDVGIAASPDGQFWFLVSEEAPDIGHHGSALGDIVFDADGGRVLLWAGAADGTHRLFSAATPDVTPWIASEEEVTLRFGSEDAPAEPFLPTAVLLEDAGFVAYFARTGADGRPALHRASSDNGLRWQAAGTPLLSPGERGDWDGEGLRAPDVARYRGGYVLSYIGAPYVFDGGVGLAFSHDGLAWTRHVDNPVVRPEIEGFDLGGISSAGLMVVDGGFRLIYTGLTVGHRECPTYLRASLGGASALGLTTLEPSPQAR